MTEERKHMHKIINNRWPKSFNNSWGSVIFNTWINIEKRTSIKLMTVEQELELLGL